MLNKILPSLLAASLLAGCAAPVDETPIAEETIGTQESELRNGIILWFIEYDGARERFDVGVEVDRSVLADANARYIVAQLSYEPADAGVSPFDAGVSPFSATPKWDVDWEAVGRSRYRGVVTVDGTEPRNIDDVIARLSANPRPHP